MSLYPITHSIDIYHLTTVSGKDSYNSSADYTNIQAAILPMGDNILANLNLDAAFSAFQLFVYDDIDIQNADKIIDNNGVTYYVRGVPQVFDAMGMYYQSIIIQKVFGN